MCPRTTSSTLESFANSTGTHSLPDRNSPRAACERCYRYKEKCHFDPSRQSCFTCHLSKKICRPRRRKRMGRKPIVKDIPMGSYSIFSIEPNPKPRYLKRPQFGLDKILSTNEAFFDAHRHFMIGKTFVDDFRRITVALCHYQPSILADAYQAVLELMNGQKAPRIKLEKVDMNLGNRSLQHLTQMTSSVAHVMDAAVAIMLGQVLLAYNALIPLGSSTRVITRATLLGVRSWYSTLSRQPELDAITIAPVFVDTIDSLIRRELPVVRFPDAQRCIVDRFSGICSSILPLLYDLCKCSYQAKAAALEVRPFSLHIIANDPYSEIEQKIADWTPTCLPHIFEMHTAVENAVMSAQARLYRLATLLVIHRLRFPLGTEVAMGKYYSESILEELSPFSKWPSDGATGLGFDFPLLVAMMELPEQGEELFKTFEPLRYRERQSKDILKFVRFVNETRERGFKGLWFDLVEEGFIGDILP